MYPHVEPRYYGNRNTDLSRNTDPRYYARDEEPRYYTIDAEPRYFSGNHEPKLRKNHEVNSDNEGQI